MHSQPTPPSQELLIQQVCNLAKDLQLQRGRTVYDLIRSSGYMARPDLLTRQAVFQYLERNPKIIEYWQGYSENKRVNRGWYFTTDRSDVEVGYFEASKGFSKVQHYDSRAEACAEFILREANDIAGESTRWSTRIIGCLFGFIASLAHVFRRSRD